MNISAFGLILWSPFLLAFLINALVFMIGGYKVGVRRAWISLGATVVGTVISLVLAKLIAPLISSGMLNSVLLQMLVGESVPDEVVSLFWESMVQVFVAQGLFFLFLIFVTTIVRILLGYFVGRREELQEEERILPMPSAKKWGGMGVGFLHAVLYSFLLLLPFYGTMATYVPSAAAVYRVSGAFDSGDEVILELLQCVEDHPLVAVSSSSPVAAIYDTLCEAKIKDTNVNYSKMADTMEAVSTQIARLREASEEETQECAAELISILQEEVLEEEWAYELALEWRDSLKKNTDNSEESRILLKILDIVCVSREDFQEKTSAILRVIVQLIEGQGAHQKEIEQILSLLESLPGHEGKEE